MSAAVWQDFIRQRALDGSIRWTRHALGALAQETMSVRDVETALRHALVIEEYQHLHRHLPDCLVLAQVRTQAIHCVVAMNETDGYVLIVTVYQPAPEEWENDWRTRK